MVSLPHSSRRRFLTTALVAGGARCLDGWAKSPPGESESTSIVSWNRAIQTAIKASASSPCQASRSLAIIHSAAFDAFESQRKCPTLLRPGGGLSEGMAPPEASMAGACFAVASTFFPTYRAVFKDLLARHLQRFPEALRSKAQEAGAAWAQVHLDDRAGDGASRSITYIPGFKPGHWRRTPTRLRPPELPHWGQLHPFTLTTSSQFRPDPPPDLTSPEYHVGWSQVRDLGGANSTLRTADETLIARFWSCFSYTVTPAGHWPAILGDFVIRRSMPLNQSVSAYALLARATADAAIAAWDAKYTYEFWRPVHAIPMADADGNDATQPVAGWLPLLETPPHPEYVSGHSVIGQAGAEIMKHLFGGDGHSFDTLSDSVTDATRSFTSFQSCVDEMSRSRVLGGIHFPFSTASGQALGRHAAHQSIKWMDEHLRG